MKRIYAILAAGALAAGVGAAQEDHTVVIDKMAPQIRIMNVQGGVMGKPIKGAPYSAVEVTENSQTLADGTRIHNESQTQVYRDSEGRMRRENGNDVTIWDPVAGASWQLNTKNQTARKLPMGTFVYKTATDGGKMETFSMRVAGPPDLPEKGTVDVMIRADKAAAEKKMMEAQLSHLKTELDTSTRQNAYYVGGGVTTAMKRAAEGKTESLGKRMIEGVNADGTRNTMTIEAGAIGNDRAIQTVSERWYSPELQTVMSTKRSDPRTGEETFKLINVSRAEPPAYLFTVPAGYQIQEQK